MNYEKIWKKTLADGEKVEYQFSIGDRYINYHIIKFNIIYL